MWPIRFEFENRKQRKKTVKLYDFSFLISTVAAYRVLCIDWLHMSASTNSQRNYCRNRSETHWIWATFNRFSSIYRSVFFLSLSLLHTSSIFSWYFARDCISEFVECRDRFQIFQRFAMVEQLLFEHAILRKPNPKSIWNLYMV